MALNMSSSIENANFMQGTISRAGRSSATSFNIIKQMLLIKEKKHVSDILTKKSNISGYNKNDRKKSFEPEEQENNKRTSMTNLGLKLNINKYFRIKKEPSKEDLLIINKKLENKNESKEKKKISLNKSDNNNINSKLLMENYNKFNIEKKIAKKKNLSPFYKKIRYKFYNIHLNKLKAEKKKKAKNENREPIYRTKLEFVYNKLQTGPEWNNITGRKELFDDYSSHFLDKIYNIDFDYLLERKNSFINMTKQTQRNNNIFGKDVRNKNVSKFVPLILSSSHLNKKIEKLSLFPKSPFIRDNFDLKIKKLSIKKIKNLNGFKVNKSLTSSAKIYNSAPDFRRYLSRFNNNKKIGQKIQHSNENVYYPNYDSILERPKMMVIYGNKNKKQNKTTKNFNSNKFKGMSSTDIFSASDAFEKYKLSKPKYIPLFEKMTSRPSNKFLPSFMQGVYNRITVDAMTDKSLKLNNYSNGKIHYDIYKPNSNRVKLKKKEEKEEDDFYIFNNDNHFEENKVNEFEEEEKTNKMKIEVNKIVGKMDKLYNDYMSHKF